MYFYAQTQKMRKFVKSIPSQFRIEAKKNDKPFSFVLNVNKKPIFIVILYF